MRDLLHRIRMRVERLAAGVPCDDPHQLTKVSLVPYGTPRPTWPPPGAATTCGRCGAELEYIHLVHSEVRDAPGAGVPSGGNNGSHG